MAFMSKLAGGAAIGIVGVAVFFTGCKDSNSPTPSPGPGPAPAPRPEPPKPSDFKCTDDFGCQTRYGYGFGCEGTMCVFNQCNPERGDTVCKTKTSDDGSYEYAASGGDACCPSNFQCSYEGSEAGRCEPRGSTPQCKDQNQDMVDSCPSGSQAYPFLGAWDCQCLDESGVRCANDFNAPCWTGSGDLQRMVCCTDGEVCDSGSCKDPFVEKKEASFVNVQENDPVSIGQ